MDLIGYSLYSTYTHNELYYQAWANGQTGKRANGQTGKRANGQTGYPFIDACMRNLIADGWITFRMRAMLVSFASYQLWLDWRLTGHHLARLFTDYEPGSTTANSKCNRV
jgi:deoxyribodipyrimidine photo-lyase